MNFSFHRLGAVGWQRKMGIKKPPVGGFKVKGKFLEAVFEMHCRVISILGKHLEFIIFIAPEGAIAYT